MVRLKHTKKQIEVTEILFRSTASTPLSTVFYIRFFSFFLRFILILHLWQKRNCVIFIDLYFHLGMKILKWLHTYTLAWVLPSVYFSEKYDWSVIEWLLIQFVARAIMYSRLIQFTSYCLTTLIWLIFQMLFFTLFFAGFGK